MQVKLVYFGEGVTIPHTSIGLGLSFVSVWIDDSGYTSASNDVGAFGYICLETNEEAVGDPPPETAAAFSTLHGKVVTFEISPNVFARDGGIARIKLTVEDQSGGAVVERSIEFVATNCKGVAAVSNTVKFSVEMLQLERAVASSDELISDEELTAMVDEANGTAVA